MNTYALAKLIASVGEVDSRKRLHKCIFLLQLAGLETRAEYCLHYYGPFSRDVAETTDLLTQSNILEETPHAHPMGEQYSYRIAAKGLAMLADYEATPQGQAARDKAASFVDRFKALKTEPLWTLELAATLAFYRFVRQLSPEEARAKTAEFKQVQPNAGVLNDAEQVAARFAPTKGP